MGRKFIAPNTYIRKQEIFQSSNQSSQLKNLEEEKQNKPKASKQKENSLFWSNETATELIFSRGVKNKIFHDLSHKVCSNLSQQLQKTNTYE